MRSLLVGTSFAALLLVVGAPSSAQEADKFPAPSWLEPGRTTTYLRRRVSNRQLASYRAQAGSPSASTRLSAVRQLGRLGYQSRDVIDTLATVAAKDSELTIRAAACEALGKTGGLAFSAVPALCTALSDPSPRVRTYAAWALFQIRRSATKTVPIVIAALKTERDARVRASLVRALGAFRYQARSAVPLLSTCLNDTDPNVRRAACASLGWIGEPAKSALPLLTRIFNDAKDPARAEAATALGRLGEIALLIPALDDPTLQAAVSEGLRQSQIGGHAVTLVTHAFSSSRARAAAQLGALGARAAVATPALIRAVEKDTARQVRLTAARALGKLGAKAASAVPALITLVRFDRTSLKVVAAESLGLMGPAAKDAAPYLAEGLDRVDEAHQLVVAKALKGIGPGAVSALPRLVDGLQWGNDRVRLACAEAIGAVGAKGTPAVPILASALELDTSARVRAAAAGALGAIGTSARAALPALLKAAGGDADPIVSRVSRRAAAKVQGK